MKRTNTTPCEKPILVDFPNLQMMLCLGRRSCEEIAAAADAVVRIKRRKLYNVKRIEEYVDSITGEKE